MSQTFTSQIFGETRHASEEEREAIIIAVQETPVSVFQELNKKFNERELCLLISPKVPAN